MRTHAEIVPQIRSALDAVKTEECSVKGSFVSNYGSHDAQQNRNVEKYEGRFDGNLNPCDGFLSVHRALWR